MGSSHSKRMEYFLESGRGSDVMLIVGVEKREVKAHKLMLMAGSSVFDDLFSKNKDQDSYVVPDLEPNELKLFLGVRISV